MNIIGRFCWGLKKSNQMTDKKDPKVWKSFDEQLELLKRRGLIVNDENNAKKYLKNIGYYRLSGYFYSFRQKHPSQPKNRLDNFIAGSKFDDVKKLYIFDKKLRHLALDALERIEVALRTNICYTLGEYGSVAYKNSQYFDDKFNHAEWLGNHQKLLDREKHSSFIKHHREYYDDIPIWVVSEIWDFGTMSKLYKGMHKDDKDRIAKLYHLKSGTHLQTHLHAFNLIRNICAHYGRLWNRNMVFSANLKGLEPEFRQLNSKNMFVYFCLMKRMLDVICPNSTWGERFLAVLNEFPKVQNNAISLGQMGVSVDPHTWQLWQKSAQTAKM